MNCDLVDMSNNQYMLTILGKDVYESLRMMENGIKLREKFDTCNKSILDDISFIYWRKIMVIPSTADIFL